MHKPDARTAKASRVLARMMAVAVMTLVAGGPSGLLRAQVALGTPFIQAVAKGPDQINLTWSAVANAGYGYLVEIQSDNDGRYAEWTELQPIPTAAGYTCDNRIIRNGASCNISDPAGAHVYNPAAQAVPYWVTEANYIDPQDGSPAQFIS